jgi:hypothetical protein
MPIGEGISGKEEGSPMADAAACDGGAGRGREGGACGEEPGVWVAAA